MSSIPPTFLAPPGFKYDLSEWPICVTIRSHVPNDGDYEQHLRTLDAMLAQGDKQVHILDREGQNPARSTQLKLQAAWNDRNNEALARSCLGIGMVIRGPLQRLGMGTMLALMKRPVPYQIFSTREGALAWARKLVHRQAAKDKAAL